MTVFTIVFIRKTSPSGQILPGKRHIRKTLYLERSRTDGVEACA